MKSQPIPFVDTPPSNLSRELLEALHVEPASNLKLTLVELEYGDRQWDRNLCRAIELAWHLGAIGRNLKQDTQGILNYLLWASEEVHAGFVDRSEAELKLIWDAIAILYLRIAALR